ncbi:MAG: hypothetical protein ACR2QS_16060 [Woeseiaceae bacterium]
MGLLEFVTVMVSMILALCLGHLLRNASFLARTDREVIYSSAYATVIAADLVPSVTANQRANIAAAIAVIAIMLFIMFVRYSAN